MVRVKLTGKYEMPGGEVLSPGEHTIKREYLDHWFIKSHINAGHIVILEDQKVVPEKIEEAELVDDEADTILNSVKKGRKK